MSAGRRGAGPAGAVPTRDRILRLVRDAPEPVSALGLAAQLGIHPNTVRFHLDSLIRDGAIERADEPPAPAARAVGRPALRYRRAGRMSPSAGRTDYRLLAAVLVGHVAAGDDPAAAALRIGRTGGAALLAQAAPPDAERLPGPVGAPGAADTQPAAATERMIRALDSLGFQPEAEAAGVEAPAQIGLRHCPFLDLAMTNAEVTCSLHLGLLQGAFDAMDSPIDAIGIEPFAQPDLCVVRLGRRSER